MHDAAARAQALDITQSFIVQAPAGSGKTELLIQRFLKLLQAVEQPEHVLAITFTNKAVNEMRHRLLLALTRAATTEKPSSPHEQLTWQLAHNVLQRDKARAWHLLQNPHRLRIHTIDGFCARLQQQMPLLSQLGGGYSITDNPDALYQEAIERWMEHLDVDSPWQAAMTTLLLHCDNNFSTIEALLMRMLARRDQWLPHLHAAHSRETLEDNLRAITDGIFSHAASLLPGTEKNDLLTLVKNLCDYVPHDHTYHAIHDDDSTAHLRIFSQLLLTKDGDFRKTLTSAQGFQSKGLSKDEERQIKELKTHAKDIIAQLESHEELRHALHAVQLTPAPRYTEQEWHVLAALLSVLPVLCAELHILFGEHGQIDYVENSLSALRALGDVDNPTDLALRMDYQIQHILMDEFQDTSLTQWRLLEKLVAPFDEKNSLFLVGDPMQSIYRFRQADVGLFLRAREHGIGHIPLTPLTLTANFRSTAPLVDWFNQLFFTVFPTHSDINTSTVHYHASEGQCEGDMSVDCVQFKESSATDEADYLVKYIKTKKENFPEESIAILVRAKTHLHALMPALKAAEIPFQAVDIDSLAETPVCYDLLHMTRAYLHLADNIAWLALLRMPFVGVALHDIEQLATQHTTLWEAMHLNFPLLSADGNKRIAFLINTFTPFMHDRARDSLAITLERLWNALGGKQWYSESTLDAEQFFALISQLEKHSDIDIEQLTKRCQTLYASAICNDAHPVQIMTIHKAKGLEFDTVCLPHCHAQPRSTQNDLLLLSDYLEQTRARLLMAPLQAATDTTAPLYDFIKKRENTKQSAELVRLLYVACTRAKKNILITAFSAEEESTPHPASTLHLLAKHVTFTQHRGDNTAPTDEKNPTPLQRRIAIHTHHSEKISASTTPVRDNHFVRESTLVESATGTITHLGLALIATHGIAWWQQLPSRAEWIRARCQQHRLPQQAQASVIDTVTQAIENTLRDERGRWILHPHRDAHAEFALSGKMNGECIDTVIDRTFLDETNTRWIIDYKITTSALIDPHREQLETYAALWRAFRPNEIIHTALYFPLLQQWDIANNLIIK